MNDESSCRRERLIQNGIIAIDACTCGKWHLHVGPMTLRLMPDAAEELALALQTALQRRAEQKNAPGRDALAVQAATLLRGL